MPFELPPIQTKICSRCQEKIESRFDNTFHLLCKVHENMCVRREEIKAALPKRVQSGQGFTDEDVKFLKEMNISL